jgi:hypothetical protein
MFSKFLWQPCSSLILSLIEKNLIISSLIAAPLMLCRQETVQIVHEVYSIDEGMDGEAKTRNLGQPRNWIKSTATKCGITTP